MSIELLDGSEFSDLNQPEMGHRHIDATATLLTQTMVDAAIAKLEVGLNMPGASIELSESDVVANYSPSNSCGCTNGCANENPKPGSQPETPPKLK